MAIIIQDREMRDIVRFATVFLLLFMIVITGCSTEQTDTNNKETNWKVSPSFSVSKPGMSCN